MVSAINDFSGYFVGFAQCLTVQPVRGWNDPQSQREWDGRWLTLCSSVAVGPRCGHRLR